MYAGESADPGTDKDIATSGFIAVLSGWITLVRKLLHENGRLLGLKSTFLESD